MTGYISHEIQLNELFYKKNLHGFRYSLFMKQISVHNHSIVDLDAQQMSMYFTEFYRKFDFF